MRCPIDQTEMRFHTCRREGVHECDSCRGLWIGFAAQQECFHSNQRASLSTAPKPRFDPDGGRSLRCPECPGTPKLDVLKVAKVEIDRCPTCHGVWFDADEFQALLDLKAKFPGPTMTERVGDGVMTAADPIVGEPLIAAIAHAGEVSVEAARVIAEAIGDILGGLFSGF